ncbi:hypothetical protein G6F29_011151 [Rhizopus arrhizus]|uniref:Thioredoxin domain-containing protein n=1 Tax=Rhizopus oryzae TaxID=64495 RepID=A0A9P6X175_RHIOR|nr:hypothetical protein G6F20_011054 [Rhizopus arrhizus]KAG0913696.1 hypothetical protein G6F33_004924 [Rhizopus arrhizus]KAG0931293.1 hypothetical protein G6F30_011270 [Rhizopus arrhizus]KAG0975956.1 hypothetical protein G6F29_011151 [Rhizopus arrhizus]KAG0982688.1 hypothetical protein G6F28_011127 [Rhizopus arrhizus]
MSLRLGDTAPDFEAKTTKGDIRFHEFIGDNWTILFSHPADFTALQDEWDARNVKVIGLSANGLEEHEKWIADINEVSQVKLNFPLIADADRKVSALYDMLDHQDATNVDAKGIAFTIRSVFIIDPKKTIRLILTYPASTGRNFDEILRVVDSLQLGDKYRITTPGNWKKGDDVIVHPSVSNELAQELFPKGIKVIKPYLRLTPSPF